jgi:hypothetical protein
VELKGVLEELDIVDSEELLVEHWEKSEASFSSELPRFLTAETITETRTLGGLESKADLELHEAAHRIVSSPALLHLAWHCQRLLFEHLDYEPAKISQWPVLSRTLGDLSGAFYLLVALEAVPRIRAVHAELGIPDPVSRDTCHHYLEPVRMYRERYAGHFGVQPRALYWWRNHIEGDLYRLGRLEYMLKPFNGGLRAYRHRETGETIALAVDGKWFDRDGFATRADGEDAWSTRSEEREGSAVGFPIAPFGHAVDREVALPLSEWELTLSPGDRIMEVHIPAGGNMTPERCRESMRQALDFFPRHFPDRPFVGFACYSWILNPQLAEIYRPDANMVLWQRELYLFPVPSGNRSGLYFVFGEDEVDPDTAPRDTSMRRALLDHLAADGGLITGGMFLLSEDFEHYGTQVYRGQWSAVLEGLSL